MPTPKIGPFGIATTKGDLYVVDANGDLERLPVGTTGQALVADPTAALGVKWSTNAPYSPAKQTDVLPIPYGINIGAGAARADQTLLEGGMYYIIQPALVSKFIFRLTALAGAPTTALAMGLYQAPGGGEGVATKIASVAAFTPAATGEQQVNFAEGTVTVEQGVFYILVGRQSVGGSYSMRVYSVGAYDLWNQNIPAGTRPVTFTTAISSAVALPATFDPVLASIPSTSNTLPDLRLN